MDTTAFTLSKENNLPIIVFDMNIKDNLKVVQGKKIGTKVFCKMNEKLEFVRSAEDECNPFITPRKRALNIRAGKLILIC